jgi:hypothetical protein
MTTDELKKVTEELTVRLDGDCPHATELFQTLVRGDVTFEELSAVAAFLYANPIDTALAVDEVGKALGVDDNPLKRTS